MSAVVYRHYDHEGKLLYIGQSNTMFARMLAHTHGPTAWIKEVKTITLEHFESRAAAKVAEVQAIQLEKPAYNNKHKKVTKIQIDADVMLAELI